MITALDANVVIDVIRADARFGAASMAALDAAQTRGSVVVCAVVWAEVAALFDEPEAGHRVFERLGAQYEPASIATAKRAGGLWRAYRRAGGPRERVIADFLVAAHALEQADVLLTRDRGFAREHFDGLRIEDPSA